MASRTLLLLASLTMIACGSAGGTHDEAPLSEGEQGALTSAPAAGSVLATTTSVNFRTGPSTSEDVLRVLPTNTHVVADGGSLSNGFAHVTQGGDDGWVSAKYLKLVSAPPVTPPVTPPPSGSEPTADQLIAALGACAPISSSRWKTDASNPIASNIAVCSGHGVISWTADMDIDCDGSSAPGCTVDSTQMPDTAWHDSHGNPLDAATIPFIVVPGDLGYSSLGITGGNVVAVIYNGHVGYGIVGDVGPKGVIGEASYAMAAQFPGVKLNPNTGGVESPKVTYVVFPGASARVAKREDVAGARQLGVSLASTLVSN